MSLITKMEIKTIRLQTFNLSINFTLHNHCTAGEIKNAAFLIFYRDEIISKTSKKTFFSGRLHHRLICELIASLDSGHSTQYFS